MATRSDTATMANDGRLDMFKARFFSASARQKLLAFASLVILLIFFTLASPAFMQTANILGILQSTAVNGVLAIACTFVIITAGIDLSVGTLMTFCAVMAGVFLTFWKLPLWTGILAAIATGALSGTVSGALIAKLKIPPFIATLGMMLVLKGLSLVVSGVKPIYFNDTENFSMISQELADRLFPARPPHSQRGADPVHTRDPRLDRHSPAQRSDATPSRSAATRKRFVFPASMWIAGRLRSMDSAAPFAASRVC